MRKRLALALLVVAIILLAPCARHALQYAVIDYGMHHQTGVLCFDYERDRSVYHYNYNRMDGNDTGVDNVEDFWRTAVDTDGEATIKGYKAPLSV